MINDDELVEMINASIARAKYKLVIDAAKARAYRVLRKKRESIFTIMAMTPGEKENEHN